MNGMLVLIMTGPDEEKGGIKVSEGLHILESVAIKGKGKIRIVLKGEGVSLRDRLLGTGDKEVVEASPRDRIWGVGFGEKNAGKRKEDWGLNLLGKALMVARNKLREEGTEHEDVSDEAKETEEVLEDGGERQKKRRRKSRS